MSASNNINPYCTPEPSSEPPRDTTRLVLPIVATFSIDQRLMRLALETRLRGAVFGLRCIMATAVAMVIAITLLGTHFDVFDLAAILFFVGAMIAMRPILVWATLRSSKLHDTPGILGEHRIVINDEYFEESTDVNLARWRMEVTYKVEKYRNFLVVYMTPVQFLVIPDTADFGSNHYEAVWQFLNERINHKLFTMQPDDQNDSTS